MKKIIYTLVVLTSVSALGQTTTKNFVKSYSLNQARTTTVVGSNDKNQANQSIQYVDGLGRPSQSIIRWGAGSNDLITPIEYDVYGRELKKYLPYEKAQTGGEFSTSPITEQNSFYDSHFGGSSGDFAFAEMRYETSPRSRVLEETAPGSGWQMGGGHTATSTFGFNSVSDAVKKWEYADLQVSAEEFYADDVLSKTVATDEDGNETVTFADMQGRTLLKKSSTGDTNKPWAETYYIYDDRGNLKVVLPPQAVHEIASYYNGLTVDGFVVQSTDVTLPSGNSNSKLAYTLGTTVTIAAGTTLTDGANIKAIEVLTPDFLEIWAFQYTYDERNRMVEKSVPGADPVFMVYDNWDRLVLTQDGNQRAGDEWLFTSYDALNRPVITGVLKDTNAGHQSQEGMQDWVMGLSSRYLTPSVGNSNHSYNTAAFPFSQTGSLTVQDVLTVTYYDDYAFVADMDDLVGTTYQYETEFTSGTYHIVPNQVASMKGQVTGAKTKKIGETEFIESITYYDDKYRPIQQVSTNHLDGTDVVNTQYDFAGNPRKVNLYHTANGQTTEIRREFDYDHLNRPTEIHHQINNGPNQLIVENSYNELGELEEKDLHGGEQSVDYDYNMRGWLKAINQTQLTLGADSKLDLFGMELFYNTTSGLSGQSTFFNGNISATTWSDQDNNAAGVTQRGYTYEYDNLNRLTDADHFENGSTTNAFDVSGLSYDLNGNILGLTRKGSTGASIDVLDYHEDQYVGNQLQKVTDSSNDAAGFDDGASGSGTDYTYDANGNMISDNNKGITNIDYNHLNLPTEVTMSGSGNRIEYLYDAAGIKLQQKVIEGGNVVKTTDYVGEFIYEDHGLQLIQHEEGRIVKKEEPIVAYQGSEAGDFTPLFNVSLTTDGIRTNVVTNQNASTPGVTVQNPSVAIGKTYTFRVKGYSQTGNNAYLWVKGNNTGNIVWLAERLPFGASNEDWVTATFTLPAGNTSLITGVLFKGNPVIGDSFYISETELVEVKDDYQYHLKDHLGNARLTFSTLPESYNPTASFEDAAQTEENEQFGNANLNRVPHPSTANSGKAQRLNNATPAGAFAVLSVNKGDTVSLSVDGYHEGGSGYSSPISASTMETKLQDAFKTSGVLGREGVASSAIDNGVVAAIAALGVGGSNDDAVPGAYLNYLVFDKNMNYLGIAGFTQVSQTTNSEVEIAINDILMDQDGFLIAYLSNESNSTNYVHFDNFEVYHGKTNIVQVDDYYPFGLTFNSYQRTASTAQNFLNQGKELEEELGTYDFHARMYDPVLGRTWQIDPMADAYYSLSPYSWVANNPLKFLDPTGMFLHDYKIQSDGTIQKTETNDSFDTFTYVDEGGAEHLVGQYDKNESGMIKVGNIDDSDGSGAKVSTKTSNSDEIHLSGEALASVIGASADSGQEIYITRASNSDGTSPGDSESHVDGKNMDIRFAGKDGSRSSINYKDSKTNFDKIDQTASASMNSSLKKFGFKDIRASQLKTTTTATVDGKSVSTTNTHTVSGTTHLKNHYDHQHLQGYTAPVRIQTPILNIKRKGIQP